MIYEAPDEPDPTLVDSVEEAIVKAEGALRQSGHLLEDCTKRRTQWEEMRET